MVINIDEKGENQFFGLLPLNIILCIKLYHNPAVPVCEV
jgi:hypothetical protein